jgi:protein-tyrosine-phosphatase
MAEGLFRKATSGRDDYATSSAGVSASRNTPCNPETAAVLKKREASIDAFKSRPVSEKILAESTHVFAMTRGHLHALETEFPKHSDKFYLVGEFLEPAKGRAIVDVQDPIGMGRAAYEEVADLFDAAIPTIIAYIDHLHEAEEPLAR